jgi:ATP-dependent RNA helicase RhlE
MTTNDDPSRRDPSRGRGRGRGPRRAAPAASAAAGRDPAAATTTTAAPAAAREATRPSAFAALGLAPELQQAIAATGYTEPTPIQVQAIPPALAGRDLLGCAQTGTGKTAAFALPILQRLASERPASGGTPVRALVLAPTRELAAQIAASFERYGRRSGLRTAVVFGGVSKGPQAGALRRGVDVLVATPGRLLDLMGERVVSLGAVQVLVLDEADRMLDMGFIHDVRRVVRAIPRERQTMLFSATLPEEIRKLAEEVLDDPVRVAVTPVASTVDSTEQRVFAIDKASKVELLYTLLQDGDMERVLVFTRTKHGADKVAKKLVRAGVGTAALHGNKSQNARERALEGFKQGRTRVIVATDIAARGLDVKGLSHVVNFDLPNEPETYVHRIGRTGRAGAVGVALSFCAPEERDFLRSIERLTRRALDRVELPRLVEMPQAPLPAANAPLRGSEASRPGASERRGSRPRGRGVQGPSSGGSGPRERSSRSESPQRTGRDDGRPGARQRGDRAATGGRKGGDRAAATASPRQPGRERDERQGARESDRSGTGGPAARRPREASSERPSGGGERTEGERRSRRPSGGRGAARQDRETRGGAGPSTATAPWWEQAREGGGGPGRKRRSSR